ncbi:MAG: hypothetical protein JWQ25_745 [Daejeonella sp.]|nr:hypothetical protein [Daejeonella sp.]
MKKTSYLFLSFMLTLQLSFGQTKPDSIQTKKAFSTFYLQNGKILSPKQLLKTTETNPESYKEMKIAKSNADIGQVFSFSGGFLVGYSLGGVIGGKPNWTPALIGGGLIIASIPFSSAYAKHAKAAVKIYNQGMNQLGFRRIEYYPALTANGIGLTMKF